MGLIYNKVISLLILISIYGALSGQTLNWKSLNGPMGGFVGDIAINSKGDLFVGLYSYHIPYYGLFKSTNNGISWERLSLPFYWSQIYSLYVTKDDHIWVGTYYGDRVYLSTDNGETWIIRNNGFFGPACWAFGQTKTNVLLGGDAQYGRLYRTTNYGAEWKYVTRLGPLAFATDTNNVVYMGTHIGLFASSDDGLTWTQRINNISVSTILIDKDNNIYCGTGYYDQGNGILFSSDGGTNWSQIGLSGMTVLSLAMDSEGNIYAGTLKDGLFKTTNKGQSWLQITNGLNGADVFRLKINKNGDVFVGAENEGVYRLKKRANKFEQIGVPVSFTQNFVFFQDSLIFASTPSGVQKYNENLKKWTNIGLRGVNKVAISSNNNLYAGTDYGLYKSTDLGSSWRELRIANDTVFKIYNFEVISDDTIFIKVNYNLRYTYDGGATWVTTNIQADHWSPVLFYSKTGGLFFTGYALPGYTYNLYRSRDGCITIDTLLIGAPMNYYYNNFLVTDNGYGYFGGGWDRLLYRTSDFGNSWVADSFYVLYCVYAIDDSIVLIGSFQEHALGISKDYGNNWSFLSLDTNYESGIIDIKYKDGVFYFATINDGMFYAYFDDILDVEKEENNLDRKNYTLYQNYPNPFNSKTKIRFTIPTELNSTKGDAITTLKVYDLLGREIATLVNEPKQAGEYEVEFDADKYKLSSGVYFYQLRSGSFVSTKKFVLTK